MTTSRHSRPCGRASVLVSSSWLTVARQLERLDIYWMEEPLHRADYEGMRALRDATDVRIAGGEMTRQLHELRELMTRGCLDVLQPDVALVGGITGLRRAAILAQEHGVVFTPHTWTNGMGVTANAHLVAGIGDSPFIEYPFDPPQWDLPIRDFMMAEPLVVDQSGWLNLPETAGMGYEVNVPVLERTRIS
jgi:L-alanine-DL-glutamate epimerase-like enolase superfamily enzyme